MPSYTFLIIYAGGIAVFYLIFLLFSAWTEPKGAHQSREALQARARQTFGLRTSAFLGIAYSFYRGVNLYLDSIDIDSGDMVDGGVKTYDATMDTFITQLWNNLFLSQNLFNFLVISLCLTITIIIAIALLSRKK